MRISIAHGAFPAAALACAGLTAPAMAQEIPGDLTISGNVALVTDYRFRGVSFSGGDPAIQGGIDVAHSSGFYVGAWASSYNDGVDTVTLDNGGVPAAYEVGTFGEMELDVYGGWTGEITPGIALDIGMLYYIYPAAQNRTAILGANGSSGLPTFAGYADYPTDFFEPYASLSTAYGPVSATVGLAYGWEQAALGDKSNLYVYTDLGTDIPGTPFSLSAHLGYTDGYYAPPFQAGTNDDTGFDYSIGASATVLGGLTLGVSYVGVDGPSIDDFTDDAVVGSLSYSF